MEFSFAFDPYPECEFFNILWITMKINNSIEIKIKMHTESQNHTSTQEKNERTYFYIKKSEGRTGI